MAKPHVLKARLLRYSLVYILLDVDEEQYQAVDNYDWGSAYNKTANGYFGKYYKTEKDAKGVWAVFYFKYRFRRSCICIKKFISVMQKISVRFTGKKTQCFVREL